MMLDAGVDAVAERAQGAYMLLTTAHILNLAKFIELGGSLEELTLVVQHPGIASLVLQLEPKVLQWSTTYIMPLWQNEVVFQLQT